MIESAKITAAVQKLGQFDVAIMNFKTKYNGLPGDARAFGGDGNGFVRAFGNFDSYFEYEVSNFWNHLSTFQKIKKGGGTYSTSTASPVIPERQIPALNLGNKYTGALAFSSNQNWGAGSRFYNMNTYLISGFNGTGTNNHWLLPPNVDHSLSVPEALAMDKKIDDGVANTGNVQVTGNGMQQYFWQNINSTAGSGCVLNTDLSKYNVTSTAEYPCSLGIRIGAQVGQPQ